MTEQDERRERRERRLQTMAFVGASLVLALVLFGAFSLQSSRRLQEPPETTATPTRIARAVSASPTWAVPPLPTPYVGYPPPRRTVSLPVTWYLQEHSGVLDPVYVTEAYTVPQALFLGLTMQSTDGEMLLPALATYWEASPDEQVYTFYLRPHTPWVQCDPSRQGVYAQRWLTAEDVVFAIERALHPETRAPQAERLYPIAGAEDRHRGDASAFLGVEAVDSLTVRFTLAQPTPDLAKRLAEPIAWPVPREPIATYGEAWTEPGKIWVNGGLCPVAWERKQGLTLIQNPWFPLLFSPRTVAAMPRLTPLPRLPTPPIGVYPTIPPD